MKTVTDRNRLGLESCTTQCLIMGIPKNTLEADSQTQMLAYVCGYWLNFSPMTWDFHKEGAALRVASLKMHFDFCSIC